MNKKLLNEIKNFDMDNFYELLDSEIKQAFFDSYLSPSFQGWFSKVMLYENGGLSLSGIMSNGSGLMSEYEGTSISLFTVEAYSEFDCDIICKDHIEELLNEEQQKELYDYLVNEYNLEADDNEELTFDDVIYDHSVNIDGAFAELFNDIYKDQEKSYVESLWDDSREYYIDKLENSLRDLRYRCELSEEL